METYQFNYVVQNVEMVIEAGVISYKYGLSKGKMEVDKITNFRVFEYQDYDQLVIRYKTNEGKYKNFKVFADKSSQGLNAFVNRLSELLPDKNLAQTNASEARKILKVANSAKFGVYGAIVVIIVVLFFIFKGVFKDIENNMPIIIIGGIVVVILIIAFAVTFFKAKSESKDW